MAQYSGIFTTTQQMQAKAASNWPSPPVLVEYLVVAGGGGGDRGVQDARAGAPAHLLGQQPPPAHAGHPAGRHYRHRAQDQGRFSMSRSGTTRIAHHTQEAIYVRGTDLVNDLIGKVSGNDDAAVVVADDHDDVGACDIFRAMSLEHGGAQARQPLLCPAGADTRRTACALKSTGWREWSASDAHRGIRGATASITDSATSTRGRAAKASRAGAFRRHAPTRATRPRVGGSTRLR